MCVCVCVCVGGWGVGGQGMKTVNRKKNTCNILHQVIFHHLSCVKHSIDSSQQPCELGIIDCIVSLGNSYVEVLMPNIMAECELL